MEGPIAAPNKPQALETSPMIEADSGLAAISRAMTLTMHNVQCTINVQCAMCNVQCTMYNQCTMCNVQ